MPPKSRDARRRSSHLPQHYASSNKENHCSLDNSPLAQCSTASHASVTAPSSLPSTLKRVNTSPVVSPVVPKVSFTDASPGRFLNHVSQVRSFSPVDRLSRFDQQSTSTPFTTPSLSRLSLSSDTPSSSKYAKNTHDGPSIDKLRSFELDSSMTVQDEKNYFHLIHVQAMLDLLQQTHCCSCHQSWRGNVSTSKREGTVESLFRSVATTFPSFLGIYSRFVFTCSNCLNEMTMNSSPQVPNS
jgi:ribosomal protein L31